MPSPKRSKRAPQQRLPDSPARADDSGAARLPDLIGVRVSREAVLVRQRATLAAACGEDDPRVRALDARIKGNRRAIVVLSKEVARARTPVPTAGADECVLYGFVRDEAGTCLPGLTVAVYATRRRIEERKPKTTDQDGRFLLRVPLGGKKKGGTEPPSVPASVRVLDAKKRRLHEHPDPIAVAPGTVTYLEMTVPAAKSGRRGAR